MKWLFIIVLMTSCVQVQKEVVLHPLASLEAIFVCLTIIVLSLLYLPKSIIKYLKSWLKK
jgi:hypothetical protein